MAVMQSNEKDIVLDIPLKTEKDESSTAGKSTGKGPASSYNDSAARQQSGTPP